MSFDQKPARGVQRPATQPSVPPKGVQSKNAQSAPEAKAAPEAPVPAPAAAAAADGKLWPIFILSLLAGAALVTVERLGLLPIGLF